MLTDNSATINTINPAKRKIMCDIVVLYSNDRIHSVIPHQARGVANKTEIPISLRYSWDNNIKIFVSLEPSALRMPISLVRCTVVYADKPKSPRQPITMARDA